MTKVIVPNRSSHDFSDASRYGEVLFMTVGTLPKYSVADMTRVWNEFFIKHEISKDDYILPSALPIFTHIGCALFALKFGQLNLLLFVRNKYAARKLMLKEFLGGSDDFEHGKE